MKKLKELGLYIKLNTLCACYKRELKQRQTLGYEAYQSKNSQNATTKYNN